MRPLPRLLAFTDDRVAVREDLGVRAAAIAAAGPSAGLVARLPNGSTDRLAALAQRYVALAAPPMAMVLVTGRADVALTVKAHGVILRKDDLDVGTVRQLCQDDTMIFRSVHSFAEAESAVRDGADAVIVGSIWPSATHPGRLAAGTGLLAQVVSLGTPTYAIGGVTAAHAIEARTAGAWGVAAISAVWDAEQPYRAAMELIAEMTACN